MAKGNFFKTIASAFVEVEDDDNITPQNQTVNPVNTPIQSVPTAGSVSVNDDGTIQPQLDTELFEKLCEVVEESNIPGPDYVELTKAAQNENMKNAIPDENSRFMAAYISIKATAPQLNKGVVLGSIDTYIDILEKERQNGLSELQGKWVENVDMPEKEIARAQEDIVRLQQELQKKIQFVSEEKNKVINAKNEYNIKKANFNHTFDVFIKKLKDDKEKFNLILQD